MDIVARDETAEPPVPAEADLRDFAFMPLDINRLFGSAFHARTSDAEWRAGMTLYLRSFHQVPAGSLPEDDIELCRLAELGRDLKTWRKIKQGALHGWTLCSDGRLYHATVAEKVNEAWRRKREQRQRTEKARLAASERRLSQGQPQTAEERLEPAATESVTELVTATKGQRQGQGERQGQGQNSEPDGSGGAPPRGDSPGSLFGAGVDWLQSVTGKSNGACRTLIGRWRRDLGDDDALLRLVEQARGQSIQAPESWFAAAIRRRKAQRVQAAPPRTAEEAITQLNADPDWVSSRRGIY